MENPLKSQTLEINKSFDALRSECTKGLVPATSPCNKSWGPVPSCELAIFASKSSRRDQLWSLRLVLRIQTSLKFWDKSLRLIQPSKRFVRTVRGISPCDQSLRVNSSGDLLQGLIPSCVPTFISWKLSTKCTCTITAAFCANHKRNSVTIL